MKLVLMSAVNTPEITRKIVELVGKPAEKINVVIINEASAPEAGDKRWLFKGFDCIAKSFGGEIDICQLLHLGIDEIEKRVCKADVIWCFGGSTDYLKFILDKTGFAKLLPKVFEENVWVGSSAGACVLGNRPTFSVDKETYGTDEYLRFVNFSLRPHIWSDYVAKDMYGKCLAESKRQPYPVYAISDECAIIVENQKAYLIGKRGQKIENGIITEEV